MQELWTHLSSAKRIVVKAGTRVLLDTQGHLVESIAALKNQGKEVILVSSGAIGIGMRVLGLERRPKLLPDLQMAAAVGQTRLMSEYERLFAEQGCKVGQVLLTYDDLKNRKRHLNARNTMVQLLRNGVIPIVNENDVVSVDEIKVGDNDILASLVALLINAEVLVLLSTTDGLHRLNKTGPSERIDYVPVINQEILALAKGKGSELSTGGMATKLRAAQNVVNSGGLALIADGREPDVLEKIFSGQPRGTLFGTLGNKDTVNKRKQWIAYFNRDRGKLIIDDGARKALRESGKSLLPVGIKEVQGKFAAGSLVRVEALSGELIGRGLVDYSSDEIEKIKGLKNLEEVIHRDNLHLESEG